VMRSSAIPPLPFRNGAFYAEVSGFSTVSLLSVSGEK
jgi:hypothetical protein